MEAAHYTELMIDKDIVLVSCGGFPAMAHACRLCTVICAGCGLQAAVRRGVFFLSHGAAVHA